MRLIDLEPRFMRQYEEQGTWVVVDRQPLPSERMEDVPCHQVTGMMEKARVVQTLDEANAILFCCPKCFVDKGNTVIGVHKVCITFANRGVPDHLGTHNKAGEPVRWSVSGTDFTNLTLQPSIACEDGCMWHGFVTNGDAT